MVTKLLDHELIIGNNFVHSSTQKIAEAHRK